MSLQEVCLSVSADTHVVKEQFHMHSSLSCTSREEKGVFSCEPVDSFRY